jgi:toxin FitB
MIILDTNVLSALMRSKSEPAVVAWLNAQSSQSIWTTAVSLFEIEFGLATMPSGKKHNLLKAAFEAVVKQDLNGRVLNFDSAAAEQAAGIASKLQAAGRRGEIRDLMIGGITAAQNATLATRNTKDFVGAGILLLDPWQGGPP